MDTRLYLDLRPTPPRPSYWHSTHTERPSWPRRRAAVFTYVVPIVLGLQWEWTVMAPEPPGGPCHEGVWWGKLRYCEWWDRPCYWRWGTRWGQRCFEGVVGLHGFGACECEKPVAVWREGAFL